MQARATVVCDCPPEDTYEALAKFTMMDMRNIKEWLDPYKPEKNLRIGDKFTVPNRVPVVIGSMFSLTHYLVRPTAEYCRSSLARKGFNVPSYDWYYAEFVDTPPSAGDVEGGFDTMGLVFFGHGDSSLKGKFDDGPKDGALLWGNGQEISPGAYKNGWFGILVLKACFAAQGGWPAKVSNNGVSWIGSYNELAPWTWGIRETCDAAGLNLDEPTMQEFDAMIWVESDPVVFSCCSESFTDGEWPIRPVTNK